MFRNLGVNLSKIIGIDGFGFCQEFDNIFALCCHAEFRDRARKGNIEWCMISLQIKGVDLRKQIDLVNKLHSFTFELCVKGAESNIFTCKLRAGQLFLNPTVG